MKLLEYSVAFSIGSFAYTMLEILWRGYTHWSMTLTGGACLALLYMWNSLLPTAPLMLKCAIGALTITAVEFIVGCVFNRILNLGVWDYSDVKYNILGQVCLPFTFLWFLLAIPGFYICDFIRKIMLL